MSWAARRAQSRIAVLLCAAAVVGGSWYAYAARPRASSPAATAAGYFAALQRGDAAGALGYGSVPAGPHALLTATVLREQQRIAPIADVRTTPVRQQAGLAVVAVHYRLGFASGPVAVTDRVRLHRDGARWRLNRVAVRVVLVPEQASDRMALLGARLPTAPTALFPGAAPVRLDTTLLSLAGRSVIIRLDGDGTVRPKVVVSPAGNRAARAAVGAALRHCVTAGAAPTCPLPSEATVPGSVRGTVTVAGNWARLAVDPDPSGQIAIRGTAHLRGTWRRLGFTGGVRATSGTVRLPVTAYVYSMQPLLVQWGPS